MKAQITNKIPEGGNNILFNNPDADFNFPDTKVLLKNVKEILGEMSTDEMIKCRKNNYNKYSEEMAKKFPEFSNQYYFLFNKIITGENITPLFKMINIINLTKQGVMSPSDGEKQIGEMLMENYTSL